MTGDGSRIASPDGKIQSVQVLRFAAAMLVVFMHALALARSVCNGSVGRFEIDHLSEIGAAGVDIFFVISGFVIGLTGPLAARAPTAIQFIWRRWSRVAPIYFIISIPYLIIAARHGPLTGDRLVATYLFWPAAGAEMVQPYVEVGWTLCFEMLFYATVSLLLIGGRMSMNGVVVGALIGLACLLRPFVGWLGLHMVTNPIFLEFGFGVLLAMGRRHLERMPGRLGVGLIAAGGLILALEVWLGVGDAYEWQPTLRDTNALWRVGVFGLPAALLVAGALGLSRPSSNGTWVLLSRLGDTSYAIYITHTLALAFLANLFMRANAAPELVALAGIAASLGVGVGVYYLIERPLIRDLKRIRP